MDLENICRKIFALALEHNAASLGPVAYVNLKVGAGFPYTDSDMWKTFNNVRWDTVLSSAELFIERLPDPADTSLRVVSLTGFEEEGAPAPVVIIEDGLILV